MGVLVFVWILKCMCVCVFWLCACNCVCVCICLCACICYCVCVCVCVCVWVGRCGWVKIFWSEFFLNLAKTNLFDWFDVGTETGATLQSMSHFTVWQRCNPSDALEFGNAAINLSVKRSEKVWVRFSRTIFNSWKISSAAIITSVPCYKTFLP